MLAAIGYVSGHHNDDTVGDGTAYYNARAEIVTTGMNTNAAAFEPTGRGGDYTEDDDDDEEDAAMLVAQHEDLLVGFIVDSGAQSHNLQDIGPPGLERSNTSATGFIVSPPNGVAGSPRALVDGGGRRHNVEHIGPFKATTEDGQSIVIPKHGERSRIREQHPLRQPAR